LTATWTRSQACRIVSSPNFAHWPNRLQVAAGGMPVTRVLPYRRHHMRDIRVGTCADFEVRRWPNLRASVAVLKFDRG
jgi:hypothetical protein